ncbi:JmjC domain-containing protein 8 [Seminavis robusta]|uniref:JmjC domain-containing protein 8 n=1 Tax=Seminavis robusta TaxID=568900 RepID=A0A9N8ECL0_9STRA|nr:JmjC domain-containing protein 8 [Seminavis robusta]|eukprot:Sro950_g223750.1 JmjC domain-containing protein 8 (337) ;mRNA; f:19549-20559
MTLTARASLRIATNLFFFIIILTSIKQANASVKEQDKADSWQWLPEAQHPCTIQRYTLDEIYETFGPEGVPALHETPLVVVANGNDKLRQLTQEDTILSNFPPNFTVTLSSSNSFSQHRRTVPLETYLDEMSHNNGITSPHQLSNESWYLFGETFTEDWKQVTKHYELPPGQTCQPEYVALSFGVGNRGSGVQWHIHGPGFSEALHGRKHWVLYPPHYSPPFFHHDQSTRNWMEYTYTNETKLRLYHADFLLKQQQQDVWQKQDKQHSILPNGRPYECTLEPGDLIYFPDRWHHATLNCDPYTAFISTFTSDHLYLQDDQKRQKTGNKEGLFRREL